MSGWRDDIQHNDTQHKDIQHKDIQRKGLICDIQHKWHSAQCTWCHYAECRDVVRLNVVMLNVVALSVVRLNVVMLIVVAPK
jgi:hypothetical protein